MQAEKHYDMDPLPENLNLVNNKMLFNRDKMFAALRDPAIKQVNVSVIKPGDIIFVDGIQKKVDRIDEHGDPVYEGRFE